MPTIVRYDPRNLARIWITGPDGRYYPISYANLSLPPITLWEHRAAVTQLRERSDCALSEGSIFQAVLKQRELVDKASAKTKSARRLAQRQKNASKATFDQSRVAGSAVDYSKPAVPYEAEVWDT